MPSPVEFATRVVMGEIPGYRSVFVPGFNLDVGDTLEDITQTGNTVIPLVTGSAATLEVVSSSSSDKMVVGTGVRQIKIHGLDANFNEINEVLNISGTAAVQTTLQYKRINAMHASLVGSYGNVAVGNIDIRGIGGTPIYSRIGAGGNMSLQAHFTVPAGHDAYVMEWAAGASSVNTASGRVLLRATADWNPGIRQRLEGVYLFQDVLTASNESSSRTLRAPRAVPPMADIKISGQRLSGVGTLVISASFTLFLRKQV